MSQSNSQGGEKQMLNKQMELLIAEQKRTNELLEALLKILDSVTCGGSSVLTTACG